jgi:peptidyl-prolyl cis-trans isomerase SurA
MVVTMRTIRMKLFRLIPVLAAAVCLPVWSRAEVADGIKAVVSEHAITYAEVEDYTRPAVEALRRQYAAQPEVFQEKLNAALNDSLEQLVERQLILKSFDVDGYKLPESVVDQFVSERIRERYGDRMTLMKTLQAQGMTFEQFRKQLREQYIESALRNQNVSREIVISPYKVETYYNAHQDEFKLDDQIKLRMIVLTKPAADDTNTIKLARDIQTKVKEGTSFTEMAGVYSQGSQQHQGGDWGWVEPAKLRPELAVAAVPLKVGETSEPIDTADSIYLMFIEDKKPAHAKPLTDVRAEIEKSLRAQQQAQLQKEWIDGLKKKTFIRYF